MEQKFVSVQVIKQPKQEPKIVSVEVIQKPPEQRIILVDVTEVYPDKKITIPVKEVKTMASKFLRWGHAPDDLRGAFEDWLEDSEAEIEFRGKKRTPDWLLGQLWHCTDIMPGMMCSELDLPQGSTYATAAQKLKAEEAV